MYLLLKILYYDYIILKRPISVSFFIISQTDFCSLIVYTWTAFKSSRVNLIYNHHCNDKK